MCRQTWKQVQGLGQKPLKLILLNFLLFSTFDCFSIFILKSLLLFLQVTTREKMLQQLISWAKHIPRFSDLKTEDQVRPASNLTGWAAAGAVVQWLARLHHARVAVGSIPVSYLLEPSSFCLGNYVFKKINFPGNRNYFCGLDVRGKLWLLDKSTL